MKIPVAPLRDWDPEEPARATFARSASLSPAARRSWVPPPLSALPLFAWLRPLKPPSLPGSFSADSPVAPIPPAIHRLVVPSRIVHLRPRPLPRHGAAGLPLRPAVSARLPPSARSSWLCVCSHWPGSLCHRWLPAPASPIRPSGTIAMPAQTVHPAWPDVVSENSLWCRDPDAGPPPDSGTPRPQRSSARWLGPAADSRAPFTYSLHRID